jgi:hypothetical protein
VTDSAHSGLRPIPLARPPEFVVCPLMREIRAFRYFWPARGHSGLTEAQFGSLQGKFPGIDIQEMETQFVAWNGKNGSEPENYVAALYGFIKQKVQRDA